MRALQHWVISEMLMKNNRAGIVDVSCDDVTDACGSDVLIYTYDFFAVRFNIIYLSYNLSNVAVYICCLILKCPKLRLENVVVRNFPKKSRLEI